MSVSVRCCGTILLVAAVALVSPVSSFTFFPSTSCVRCSSGTYSSPTFLCRVPALAAISSTASVYSDVNGSASSSSQITSLYLDISIPNRKGSGDDDQQSPTTTPLRLIFHVPAPGPLPLHTENIIRLFDQSQTSISPRCTYVKCSFRHSPQFVEGFPQYRWAHVLDGKGINAVGRGSDRIDEKQAMAKCRVDIAGSGSYYGIPFQVIPELAGPVDSDGDDDDYDYGVALTVPLSGPGRGSTSLSIVRVGDSPQEWRERLLINSAVIGWMDPSCGEALREIASQTDGPPTVVKSGIL